MINSELRTKCADKLLRNVSLNKMHNSLIDLFFDRTTNNSPINLFGDEDGVNKSLRYMHCQSLNDERTIKFHQTWKQESYVFDEKRQIWIDYYIDPIKDDMFIPRDDAQ